MKCRQFGETRFKSSYSIVHEMYLRLYTEGHIDSAKEVTPSILCSLEVHIVNPNC
jgi:hypothetical protein